MLQGQLAWDPQNESWNSQQFEATSIIDEVALASSFLRLSGWEFEE